jgi:hypothetical protein
MQPRFELGTIELIEFGVGLDDDAEGERYVLVPVDSDVQGALREMVIATKDGLAEARQTSLAYDPAEKHAGRENLCLPLDDELAANIRDIHSANNLEIEPGALANPAKVFCYFARMRDSKGHRLTAIRRATSFKGMLKSRFVQLLSDALRIVTEKLFKLDRDFDLLVDDAQVLILRPSGFEYVGELEGEIRKAVPKNVKAINRDLAFVDFAGIESYAAAHSRAARTLASIRGQRNKNIDPGKLKKACEHFGVKLKTAGGKLVVEPSSIMNFLNVLDRRLYQVELIKDEPELFLAESRSPIRRPGGAAT